MSDRYKFQREGQDIYVFIGEDDAEVKAEHLQQAFDMSEYADARLLEKGVFVGVARHYNERREQNVKLVTSFSEQVATLVDAEVQITIDDDDMRAIAKVATAEGGKTLNRSDLLSNLKSCGIKTGIQRQAIDGILRFCQEGKAGAEQEFIVAKGKYPKKGDDTRFEPLVDDARSRVLKPQEREDGTVDMRDLGQQITVNEGDALMRRHPAKQGGPGFTIRGKVLEAEDGAESELVESEGSRFSDDDPNLLVAAKVGMPWFTHNSANVDDVLTLKSVDVSTGHVDFKGSVVVSGNITEGMRVTATGDITVAGYVDSAELKAGGNITVRKGCIGHISKEDEQRVLDNENYIPTLSSKLTSDGTIWCAYAQYVYLESQQGIIVDKQLTHCHVITSGNAEIGGSDNSARGKIIGGTFESCAHVFAGQLGARAGTRTRFILSPPPPNDDTVDTLNELTEALREKLKKVKRLQLGLKRCQALADDQKRVQHSKTLIAALRKEQQELTACRDDISVIKASMDKHPTLRVIAGREVFPGVKFIYQNKNLQIKDHRGATLFMLQDHQLRMDILR